MAHVGAKDHDAIAIKAMLASLAADGTTLRHTDHLIAPLITVQAAQWINDHAPQYAQDLFPWLPLGPARDLLDPRTPDVLQAHEQAVAHYLEEQREREQAATTTRAQHQNTIRTSRDINAIILACERLQKEHWPELPPEQRDWLAQQITDTLVGFDLAHSITWQNENRWTHPRGLNPLLHLADYYHLHLTDDVPLVLALRSWADEAISNYYQREGFTPAAQEQLTELLRAGENQNIKSHVLTFLRQTGHDTPAIRELLTQIALDTTQPPQLRIDATERLATLAPATETLLTLATDQELAIRDHAFRHLVKQQHQGTIRRALATLTDDALRAGEVPIPNTSPLYWIAKITAGFAIDDLRDLRVRTLALELWRVTTMVTSTIANIDKTRAVAIIRQQLPRTPQAWQQHYAQEADKLARAARIDAVQQTPFDAIIRKLKGATSMIRIKVWCEGSTDRPVFRQLFTELGESDIAETMGLIGGWPNLLVETQPERWLDGCRQAVIIMDGDNGRKLTSKNQPLTDVAKQIDRRFANHPFKLCVLRRYGIENYFPRHACEAVLQNDLTRYFPIPPHKKIEAHFVEPQPCWQRVLNRVRGRKQPSFYRKGLNEQVAKHLTMNDVQGTDLTDILAEIKQRAEEARQY